MVKKDNYSRVQQGQEFYGLSQRYPVIKKQKKRIFALG